MENANSSQSPMISWVGENIGSNIHDFPGSFDFKMKSKYLNHPSGHWGNVGPFCFDCITSGVTGHGTNPQISPALTEIMTWYPDKTVASLPFHYCPYHQPTPNKQTAKIII